MKRTFLISPVRDTDSKDISPYVEQLEGQGYKVHWPHRDTDQDDTTGLRICRDNLNAIMAADVVHIVWDGKSQGCLFDVGMCYALGKKVVPLSLPALTEGKSFQNMITAWKAETVR